MDPQPRNALTTPPTVSYLICATPRTGSTLLCELLASTGIAGRPASYFRLPDEQSRADQWQLPRSPAGSFDYGDYVRAAVAAGSTDNGVFGARVMWGTMDEIVAKLGAAYPDAARSDGALLARAFGLARIVHLWREDTLAQAVSWARAEQTGQWQLGDAAFPGREPRFDFATVQRHYRMIQEHNAAWQRWLVAASLDACVVRYEELIADLTRVTGNVLAFLGLQVPGGWTARPLHARQADGLNEEWAARYRAENNQADGGLASMPPL